MENKRVYVTPGRTLANVQRMRRVNALTNTMKKIEIAQKAEAEVVAQDLVDPTVQRKEKVRKEEEKARGAREIKPLLLRTVVQSHVTFI